ncbi:MAG: hypothetical protein HYX75_07430 [Acidobacteria bacterium]|nr:hypothetical protein [Acidobacteriota bacterium]
MRGLVIERGVISSRPGRIAQLYRAVVLALVVLPAAQQSARSDEWVQVASGGLGDPSRRQAHPLEIVAGAVYVATHDPALNEYVYRAEMLADTIWTDVTPPWGGTHGEVTDMLSWNDDLWLSTSAGELWRRDRTGRWRDVSPTWARGGNIFGLAVWLPPGEAATRLVAAGQGVEVWSRRGDGRWDEIVVADDLHASGFVSGALGSLGRHLYLGVGGGSAGSAACQVWRFTSRGWDPVTRDGFGRPQLTWVNEMAVFGDWLYVGTAGHGEDTAGVFRMREGAAEDVTPCDLYGGCAGAFSRAPVRYGSLAATTSKLFVGTRTPSLPGEAIGADVLARAPDGSWALSNTPGFGVTGNDATTGLAAAGASLYAGTINILTGLEVWRRNAPLLEVLPTIRVDRDLLLNRERKFLRCLRRPHCPDWDRIVQPIEGIRLVFDTARYSQDDLKLILWARQSMAGATSLLDEARQLADRADKESNPKKAALLRKQAAEKVTAAIDTAVEVCRKIGV